MTFDVFMSSLERIIPWLSVLVLVGGFVFGVLKWLFGERDEGKSRVIKNNTDALSSLRSLVDDLAKDLAEAKTALKKVNALEVEIAEVRAVNEAKDKRIAVLERDMTALTLDRDEWRDRWDGLIQKVKQLSENLSGLEKQNKKYLKLLIENNIQIPRV
jgi:chromosome segregation ATPase